MTTLPDHRATRLGFGEYEPGDGIASRAVGRYLFLEAVRRRVPKVLDDLALERARDVDDLVPWAEGHQLAEPWCLTTALATVEAWQTQPQGSTPRWWSHEAVTFWLPPTEAVRAFTFTHPGWEPSSQLSTRAEAQRAIRAAFDAQLTAYLDSMEKAAVDAGFRRTPKKQSPEHFDWLAAYQVEGLSFAKIAAATGARWQALAAEGKAASPQSVAEGVRAAAALIGLTLRPPSRPGRPRKA